MLTVYEYKNCGTCKKALKFLKDNDISFKTKAIRDTPPSKKELKEVGETLVSLKKLFNTSGLDYRSLKLKDKVDGMSEKEMIELLNSNGNLVKRPFVIGTDFKTVGFQEQLWRSELLSK
jgi:Spx/MgsR family transcriptional regulator